MTGKLPPGGARNDQQGQLIFHNFILTSGDCRQRGSVRSSGGMEITAPHPQLPLIPLITQQRLILGQKTKR